MIDTKYVSNDDRPCPVACGKCCVDDWTTVKELQKRFPLEAVKPVKFQPHCPLLGDDGCTLPREERPAVCKDFLCDVGGRVYFKELSLAFAVKYIYELDLDIVLFWATYNNGEFECELTEDTQERVDRIVARKR